MGERRGLRPIAAAAAILIGAVALMSPALLNGHPSVFPDTSAYELMGQWLFEQLGVTAQGGFGYLRHRADLGLFFTIAGARSLTYGVLLFLVAIRGSAWAMIGLQAVVGSLLVAIALRAALGRLEARAFAQMIAVLAAVSTLPFFVSFVMPDVFAGYAALCALLLVFFFSGLSWPERTILTVVLAASLTFHSTNPPLIALIAFCGLIALGLRRLPARATAQGLGLVGASLCAAMAVGAISAPLVKALAHRELHRPPFLTARLLADGPGRVYLRRSCAADPKAWTLCPYAERPLTDANDILWHQGAKGVFEVSDLHTRLAIIAEEPRFVLAVLRSDPVDVVLRLVGNSALELTQVTIVDTLGYSDLSLVSKGPQYAPPVPGASFCVRRPSYCHATPFQTLWDQLIAVSVLASVIYLLWTLAGATALRVWRARPGMPAPLALCAATTLLVLLADGVLCGAISGVYPRYEMRMIWLAPMMATLAWLDARRRARLTSRGDDASA